MRDHERIAIEWGVPLALAILAVGARYCINAERFTVIGVIRASVIGLFVGAEINLYLLSINSLGAEERGALVGLSVILAQEILLVGIKAGKVAFKDPKVIFRLLSKLGGKS